MAKAMYREQQVRTGIALLDGAIPGWEQHIDLDHLDLGDGLRCVLGQAFGDYTWGLISLNLGIRAADQHGFFVVNGRDRAYRLLTNTWTALIMEKMMATQANYVLVA